MTKSEFKPCQCEECCELRLSADLEAIEFMKLMDAGYEYEERRDEE